MPSRVSFEVRELWLGTPQEYAEARQIVQRSGLAAWARAFTHAYGSASKP